MSIAEFVMFGKRETVPSDACEGCGETGRELRLHDVGPYAPSERLCRECYEPRLPEDHEPAGPAFDDLPLVPAVPLPRARTLSAAQREATVDLLRDQLGLQLRAVFGAGMEDRTRKIAVGIALDVALSCMEHEDGIAKMLGAIRDYVGISETSDDPEDLEPRARAMGDLADLAVPLAAELDERARWAAKHGDGLRL